MVSWLPVAVAKDSCPDGDIFWKIQFLVLVLYVVLPSGVVSNSLVLNHIILRTITVLKKKTFGTRRCTIVHHNSNKSYKIYNHNSIYNNDYKVTSMHSLLCIMHLLTTIHK